MKGKGAADADQPGTGARSKEIWTDSTGHTILNGARWHYPATGNPTQCGVTGCERVLGQQRAANSVFDDDDPGDDAASPDDGTGPTGPDTPES